KSHSAAYALIAYQTAWLKAHYPAAFMAAVLSSEMSHTEKVVGYINECKLLSIHIAPPDINKSHYHFKVIDDTHLAYGLGAIKGIGESAIAHIITHRNQKGPFRNLFDFCERMYNHKLNRRSLESLIKAGVFDSIGPNRASMLATY